MAGFDAIKAAGAAAARADDHRSNGRNVLVVKGAGNLNRARAMFNGSLSVAAWPGVDDDLERFRDAKVLIWPFNTQVGRREADGCWDRNGEPIEGLSQRIAKIAAGVRLVVAPKRAGKDWGILSLAAAQGWTAETLTAFLREPGNLRPPRDLNATAREAGDVRPVIRIKAGQLHDLATAAEQALVDGDAPFYVRGAALVRPVTEEVDASGGRRTVTARLTTVTPETAIDYLSRSAAFERFDGRMQQWVAADPPRAVVSTMLARDGEWSFPTIAGVITTPTLRPDGTLLVEPGYDAMTRLLLLEPPAMPEIPDRPTRNDAAAALGVLDRLLADFPFVNPASRSVALSALITPVVRGAMPVVPLHAMRAPEAGSGKSYLVDVASAIATGQRCAVIAAGKTEEETEKRLGAALLAGQPLVSIDNINGDLGGDVLCQMVERPLVRIRPLGRSELVQVESRATTFATGNNIALVGDMTRRVLLCSLDANVARPELRQFRGDPFGAVLTSRGRYIAAALTVVRAYIVAGCPSPLPSLASFEDWSRLVRSALTWLDQPDPVETMELARSEDPQWIALRAVTTAWRLALRDQALTANEIVAKAEERSDFGDRPLLRPELRDALLTVASDRRGQLSSMRLGHWLRRRKDRVVEGFKIVGQEDGHRNVIVWQLIG